MNTVFVSIVACIFTQVPAPNAAGEAGRALARDFRAILDAEASKLGSVATLLEGQGKNEEARIARARVESMRAAAGPMRFRPLPEIVAGPGKGLANLPAKPTEVAKIESETAAELFQLATRAAAPSTKRFALADACLRAVLDREPDHAEARRLLGFVPHRGGWATPFAVKMLDDGMTPHPTFGWVRESWVDHLNRGELPGLEFRPDGAPREWLPAAEADALRADWKRPWQIRTSPHFEIQTNVPLARAITFVRRLEALFDLFLSQFADVIGPANLPLAQRFAKPKAKPTLPTKKHQVWYFSAKSEYVDFLRDQFGLDEKISLGYYMPPREARARNAPPRSYFYRAEDDPVGALATLFHEASHQILFETSGSSDRDRNIGNYWVWEGLGTYFETLTPLDDGSYQIGAMAGPRIAEAQVRMIERNEYVPIEKLGAMNRERFSEGDAAYLHYAESMALTVFLLHGEQGAYRDAFLEYVANAYRGRAKGGKALETALRVSAATLNQQFRDFVTASVSAR